MVKFRSLAVAKRFVFSFPDMGEAMGNLIWWMGVGLIAGWATGKIMKGSGYGVAMDIILGICGAVVGGLTLGILGIFSKDGGLIPSIITATIGSVIIVAFARGIKKS